MWHLVVNALVHLSILLLALFGLWRLHHYTASRFNQFGVHSPTKLAVQGQYEVSVDDLNLVQPARLGVEIAGCLRTEGTDLIKNHQGRSQCRQDHQDI
jgi:hypothetical protein